MKRFELRVGDATIESVRERIAKISPVFAEQIESLSADRDARVVLAHGDICAVVMDDDGYGEYYRAISPKLAGELIACGLCRDAR